MLFSSFEFILLFLPIVFVGFYLIGNKNHWLAGVWLTCASLFFYAWWDIKLLPLLFISITINYFMGGKLSHLSKTQKGKFVLIIAITINLMLLGYFKYAGFFVSSLNYGLEKFRIDSFTVPQIVLPIGISFYTFTQIAFLVDCWQGKVIERRFLHYVLFVTYFPHLIAGPILHHSQMMPQFAQPTTYRINYDKILMGIVIFSIGLFKKMLIADPISAYADQLFNLANGDNSISFYTAWAGVLAYTFQIYFDFSGYSDMAIGISLLFGIKIPVNFNSPYLSTSIVEFWRRWHISLSTFLKDYLYIPLGGNKKGKLRRYINLFITMLLGGLWHGASLNFAIWGGLHGLYLSINHAWNKLLPARIQSNVIYRLISWFITFIAVCLAWVVFRANSLTGAKQIYLAMFGFTHHDFSALMTTLNDFLHASNVTTLINLIQNQPTYNSLDGLSLLEIISLIVTWLYSTILAFINISQLNGLQYLFMGMLVILIKFNSITITNLLDPKQQPVEKTYMILCATIGLYYLLSCLWMMDKHQVFIYYQF